MLADFFAPSTPSIVYMPGFLGTIFGKTGYGVINHSRLFDVKAIYDTLFKGDSAISAWPDLKRDIPVVASIS